MKRMMLLAASAVALITAGSAGAQSITYTFTGDFTGTLNGVDFSTPAVFTGVGDVSTLSTSGLTRYVNLSSLTAVAGGTTYNVSTTTQFYLNGGNYAGLFFGSAGDGGGAFSATGPGLAGYDAVSSLATTPFTAYFTGPVSFTTDLGAVQLRSFGNGSFTAALAGAVPEPATWAMMIAGFGMVGASLRRRTRVAVSYA